MFDLRKLHEEQTRYMEKTHLTKYLRPLYLARRMHNAVLTISDCVVRLNTVPLAVQTYVPL